MNILGLVAEKHHMIDNLLFYWIEAACPLLKVINSEFK